MMARFSAVQAQLMQASADMWRTTTRQFAGEPLTQAESVEGPEAQENV